MKNLSKKKMVLYGLGILILMFSIWFVTQHILWNIRFSQSTYLNEWQTQEDYVVKKISQLNEGYGIPFAGMVDDDTQSTSVYLDPSGQSIWINFDGSYPDHPNPTNQTYPSYWVNYTFQGEKIKSLSSDEIPPKNGIFLNNKLSGVDLDIHDPKNTLHAVSFKHESFNWDRLNPVSYYGITSGIMGTKGFWSGHALMRLQMPSKFIDFKVLTSTATNGYTLDCNYYELPNNIAQGEIVIINLKSTLYWEDEGWYFIYKAEKKADLLVSTSENENLSSLLPNGYSILKTASADLNEDGYEDHLVILVKEPEATTEGTLITDPKRPFLLILGQADGTYKLQVRNDDIIGAYGSEGASDDPFISITAKDGLFSIEHGIAGGQHWKNTLTFRYDRKQNNWSLNEDHFVSYRFNESEDPDAEAIVVDKETLKSIKDFGILWIENYRYTP